MLNGLKSIIKIILFGGLLVYGIPSLLMVTLISVTTIVVVKLLVAVVKQISISCKKEKFVKLNSNIVDVEFIVK
ncbi:MAG: hypothetical protein LBD57_04315 [Endomicrobium sp.]|jgi:hypothetical protein|uniref:hypothetical protein n=1 Tax=Candidatus Endomicrobiellum cubanum TaxID=3242325 RepID=UPI002824645E|nr:hypothetical protein [Endomicrobium sp.]